jgi:adenylylsulfate kinase-like enzyme
MKAESLDLVPVRHQVTAQERAAHTRHYGAVLWFTGVDAPYGAPEKPSIVIDTETQDVDACVDRLLAFVVERCRT